MLMNLQIKEACSGKCKKLLHCLWKVKDSSAEFIQNGVTDSICTSLGNDTGLNPENGNNTCTDMENANDCLTKACMTS